MANSSDIFRFDGKTVAVVGAASGIGEAVATLFAERGAHVSCLDVAAAKATALAEALARRGLQAEAAAIDIRDGASVQQAFDSLRERQGSLDAVICTPSINVRKTILNYTEEEFDRVVTVNLRGNFNVLRAAGRIMTNDGKGSIVLFSSIRSLVVEPGQAVYAATKAGIAQLVRTAAAEFGPSGVRVNAVGPGITETPLTAPIKANKEWYEAYANKAILKRWSQPIEMAYPTLFLASDAASYVTGTVLFVDGGWTAADGRFQPPGMGM
jgi:NAD(P)-dependent dehydrogenase (short-subunit alcohol dehydrogenase family)